MGKEESSLSRFGGEGLREGAGGSGDWVGLPWEILKAWRGKIFNMRWLITVLGEVL